MTFSNGDNSREINADELADILIIDSLKRHVNIYGLEGLEDVIKDVYSQVPGMRDRVLLVYNRLYKGEKNAI